MGVQTCARPNWSVRCPPSRLHATALRDSVVADLTGDAGQRRAVRLRRDAAGRRQARGPGVLQHRAGGEDLARDGEMLDTRGDVHRLAEVVLPLVEDRKSTRLNSR